MSRSSLTRKTSLNLIHFDGNSLEPHQVDVEFGLYTVISEDQDFDQVQTEFNITYAKILTLVQGVMDGAIVLDSQTYHEHVEYLGAWDNVIITLPVLSDSQLAAALFLKFLHICDPDTMVSHVSITDPVLGVTWTHEYTGTDIDPEILDTQYMGKYPVWPKPWWLRSDSLLHDDGAVDAQTQAVVQQAIEEAISVDDLWDQIEATVRGLGEDDEHIDLGDRAPGVIRDGDVVHVDFGGRDPHGTQ